MSHITHMRKQFKSLNKYDHIVTLIQRIKKKLYENLLVLHFNKTWFKAFFNKEDSSWPHIIPR